MLVFKVALLDVPTQNTQLDLSDSEETSNPDQELELVEVPLRSVRAVTDHIPAIETARNKITSEMETMVLSGLATLVSISFTYA